MLTLRRATLNDLPLLAQMNKRLIEDEGSANPMSMLQLETRMRGWLSSDWHIDLFEQASAVIGYAIYRFQRNEVDTKETVYIRHYYIEREARRQGLGREALRLLRTERFPKGATVYLEVLSHNTRGLNFWTALGFREYSVTMRLLPEE
jgi:ribosomal protein S18 acetylase RimI-like enzyme